MLGLDLAGAHLRFSTQKYQMCARIGAATRIGAWIAVRSVNRVLTSYRSVDVEVEAGLASDRYYAGVAVHSDSLTAVDTVGRQAGP